MTLRRESAYNLLEKLLCCKLWLLNSIRKTAPGFSLSKCDRINDEIGIDVIEQSDQGRIFTKNEHFIHHLIFCFCSDSLSVMIKQRRDCLKTKEFAFAYGCAAHAIHNFYVDLIKNSDGLKHALKQILLMVKSVNLFHLFQQALCGEI